LAAAVVIERALGFTGNLLAARLGGTSTFGAYSLAITTANNISTYAAGGIGSTAVRFSGQYDRESSGYGTLARVLLIISSVSAVIAAVVLWLGAKPIAHLLGQQKLIDLLQWTALSAAGMVLLECCRGFLVGQRRIPAILLLSLTVGVGMFILIPLTSRWGPVPMICSQGTVTLAAVALCVLLYKPLGLAPSSQHDHQPVGPMLRQVWSFGLVQLAGLVGLNAAGWWLTSLIARADGTMAQIGFFAIANQIRNMASLFPGLVNESSMAVMARQQAVDEPSTPDGVMAMCTFGVGFVSILIGGAGMVVLPLMLPLLYGKAYAPAEAATALGLATCIVHMTSGPASARLSILSIRATGVINTIWSIVVGALATTFFFWHGSAASGMAIYFGAHVLSMVLVAGTLAKWGNAPAGLGGLYVVGATSLAILLSLSLFRSEQPQSSLLLTFLMCATLGVSLLLWFRVGRRRRWAPSPGQVLNLVKGRLPFGRRVA
jgi:O-antigen/teichoic acid export membrane protein